MGILRSYQSKMSKLSKVIRHFTSSYPKTSTLTFLAILISGFFDGIGFAAFVPLIKIVFNMSLDEVDRTTQMLLDLFSFFGLGLTLTTALSFVVLTQLLKNILLFTSQILLTSVTQGVAKSFRSQIIENISLMEWKTLNKETLGDFNVMIGDEAEGAVNTLIALCNILVSLVQIVVYLTLALFISSEISLWLAIVGFIMLFGFKKLISLTSYFSNNFLKHKRKMVGQVNDFIRVLKPLKAMNRESFISNAIKTQIEKLKYFRTRVVLSNYALTYSQEVLIVAVASYGIYHLNGQATFEPEKILVIILLFQRSAQRLGISQAYFQQMVAAYPKFNYIFSFIEKVSLNQEPITGKLEEVPSFQEIHFKEVSFGYHKDEMILEKMNLTLRKGEIYTIIGPSGTGKTTVADLLSRLLMPESGEILAGDKSIYDFKMSAWREKIGYVTQETFLLNDTVYKNVSLGSDSLSKREMDESLRLAGCVEFLKDKENGGNYIVGERGSNLSGGQRQRVAIARALAKRPDILIMDESTTALDEENEKLVLASLNVLKKDLVILCVTHQKSFIDSSDRVFEVKDRKLVSVR